MLTTADRWKKHTCSETVEKFQRKTKIEMSAWTFVFSTHKFRMT